MHKGTKTDRVWVKIPVSIKILEMNRDKVAPLLGHLVIEAVKDQVDMGKEDSG